MKLQWLITKKGLSSASFSDFSGTTEKDRVVYIWYYPRKSLKPKNHWDKLRPLKSKRLTTENLQLDSEVCSRTRKRPFIFDQIDNLFKLAQNFWKTFDIGEIFCTCVSSKIGILYLIRVMKHKLCLLKWGAASRWLFCTDSAWGSTETTTIGKMHPTLYNFWVHELLACELSLFQRDILDRIYRLQIKVSEYINLRFLDLWSFWPFVVKNDPKWPLEFIRSMNLLC